MATRKLLRDSLLSGRPFLYSQLKASQTIYRTSFRFPGVNGCTDSHRQFSVFNEFSNKIRGEATSNPEFQQSVKELKQKAEELKGVKENFKVRFVWIKMVAFGKKLRERRIQEWSGYYIDYKMMKKRVRQYAQQIEAGAIERRHVLKDFSRMLDIQIEKIVLFLWEQQGLLASRLSTLNERHEALMEEPEMSLVAELREAYRDVAQDLLKLLFFVEINAVGLRKILKKFDKRFVYRFTDYYVKTRANHPWSQLQQVCMHVVMCPTVLYITPSSSYSFLFSLSYVFFIARMGSPIFIGKKSYFLSFLLLLQHQQSCIRE